MSYNHQTCGISTPAVCPAKAGRRGFIYYTYILQNSFSQRYYIGSTNDIRRRLSEHNRGQTKSTHRKGVWHLIYKESYNTSLEAHNRELKIKSYKGGIAFKKIINMRD